MIKAQTAKNLSDLNNKNIWEHLEQEFDKSVNEAVAKGRYRCFFQLNHPSSCIKNAFVKMTEAAGFKLLSDRHPNNDYYELLFSWENPSESDN